MNRIEILDQVQRLKVGDTIQINAWDEPMTVRGVSERFVVADDNAHKNFTIIGKEPVEYSWGGIERGAIVCAGDWWVFGYLDGYHFENPAWVKEYLESLESGETEMSGRNRTEVWLLEVLERKNAGCQEKP